MIGIIPFSIDHIYRTDCGERLAQFPNVAQQGYSNPFSDAARVLILTETGLINGEVLAVTIITKTMFLFAVNKLCYFFAK